MACVAGGTPFRAVTIQTNLFRIGRALACELQLPPSMKHLRIKAVLFGIAMTSGLMAQTILPTAGMAAPAKAKSDAPIATQRPGKPAPAGARRGRVLGPQRKNKPSNVKITTWNEVSAQSSSRSQPPRTVDPYAVTGDGFDGETLVLSTQAQSATFETSGTKSQAPGASFGSLRARVTAALRFEPLKEVNDFRDPPGADPANAKIGEKLRVHTPVRVVAKSTRQGTEGEVIYDRVVNAKGMPSSFTVRRYADVAEIKYEGGLAQDHYKPWLSADNAFVTPAYVPEGETQPVVDMRLVAAVPIGASVVVVNKTKKAKGRPEAEYTTRIDAKQTRTTGSAKLRIPVGTPDDELMLSVVFDADSDRADQTFATYYFRAPLGEQGDGVVDVPYHRVQIADTHAGRSGIGLPLRAVQHQFMEQQLYRIGSWADLSVAIFGVQQAQRMRNIPAIETDEIKLILATHISKDFAERNLTIRHAGTTVTVSNGQYNRTYDIPGTLVPAQER